DGTARCGATRLPRYRERARSSGHHGLLLGKRGRREGVEGGRRAPAGAAARAGDLVPQLPRPDRDRRARVRLRVTRRRVALLAGLLVAFTLVLLAVELTWTRALDRRVAADLHRTALDHPGAVDWWKSVSA